MPTTGSTRCLQTGIIIRAYIVDQRWLILNDAMGKNASVFVR